MRRPWLRFAVAAALLGAAATASAEDGPVLSGVVSATVDAAAGAGASPDFLYGMEEYANLRLKADVGDRGTVHAAVNLIASSGAKGTAAAAAGENYAALLELERLYVRIASDAADADFGLMRIAFGYGQAFRPTDFLNPPNPLLPDARPKGILGVAAAVYPSFDVKLQGFAAGGRDPLDASGGGFLSGASLDAHFSRASLQTLYAFQAPGDDSPRGINRLGLSVKAEAGAGIALDALYTFSPEAESGLEGLEAAVGADYSFLDGKLYVLLQYLYNGPGLLDGDDGMDVLYAALAAGAAPAPFNRKHYLFAQLLYSYSDYTRFGLSCLAAPEDLSFSPALTAEHEPFQGFTVGLTGRLALDERTPTGRGRYGELGPDYVGAWGSLTAAAKLRF